MPAKRYKHRFCPGSRQIQFVTGNAGNVRVLIEDGISLNPGVETMFDMGLRPIHI
jgi:hypothetical protein